jgi:hypothetical protein
LSLAVTLTGVAVVAYGITQLLTLLGVLDDGEDGNNSEDDGGDENEEGDAYEAHEYAGHPYVHHSSGAVEAEDEGELWRRAPEDQWLEGGSGIAGDSSAFDE